MTVHQLRMKALVKLPYQSQNSVVNKISKVNQTYDPSRVYQSSFKNVNRSNSLKMKDKISQAQNLCSYVAHLRTRGQAFHQELLQ